jgi:hypothetical protein
MDVVEHLRRRRGRVRLLLSVGIAAGLAATVFYLLFRPNPPITFDVFYAAAESGVDGDVVYETEHGLYVYTPIVLLLFFPFVLLEFGAALLAIRLLTVAVALGYGVFLVRFLRDHADLSQLDEVLVLAFVALSVYPVSIVATANINVLFGTCLGVGFVWLERDSDAGGVVWALAALVKIFPALWGLYLLRLRRWQAVAAAIMTGVGATLLGVVLFGIDAHLRFLSASTGSRVRLRNFAGGKSPDNEAITPVRSFAQVFPTVDPTVWAPVIAVIVVVLTALIYYLLRPETVTDRATLLLATVLGITLLMPTSQDQDVYLLYAPLLVLLFLERNAVVHWLYVVGGIVLSLNFGREELRTVTEAVSPDLSEAVMVLGEPVLAFAPMPLYGILLLYVGCLTSAWLRGKEAGRVQALRRHAVG